MRKQRNYFRTGDLLKVKDDHWCHIQTGKGIAQVQVKAGESVIFLSSRVSPSRVWGVTDAGVSARIRRVHIKIMSSGEIKTVPCYFHEVYQIFKLVRKA